MKKTVIMKKVLWRSLLITVFIVCTGPLKAEIYMYRDSQGVLHFSNVPTSVKYTAFMKEEASESFFIFPDTRYDLVIAEAARENELSFHLIKALIHVESYFNPRAVSEKGALGLMQIMPENLEALSITNPFDPRENIHGGATYLKAMIHRFDGNLNLALAAYNAGPAAVEKYNSIPPYRETREYVQKVLELYKKYENT